MPVYDQGYQVGAKQGTVFYGSGASWASKADDLSQEFTDLTVGTSCIYAESDPRFNRSSPRTIHFELTISNTSSGTIYLQGESGLEAMLTVASGVISLWVSGVRIGDLTPTGLTGTARVHQLAWVTEVDPDDISAELSWLFCWNENTSTASRIGPFSHEPQNSSDDLVVFGAADSSGTDAYTGSITIVSFHRRAMTLREIYNDQVSTAATLSTSVVVDREPLPMTVAMGLGNQDQCYGPTMAWAARATRNFHRRVWTGRSERFSAFSLSNANITTYDEWHRSILGTDYTMFLPHMFAMPVPPGATHLWVQLHCDLWVTSGSAVPTGIRVYSANRPPALAQPAGAEPFSSTYLQSVVTRNDTAAGLGTWTVSGLLPITRGTIGNREGWTYIMLGYAFDPAGTSANDANARLRFNAINLAPCIPD